MQYGTLTGTGIVVSKLCLGTMTFGGQLDEQGGIESVLYAIDNGVNFFDTANSYLNGESERILGKAISGKREKLIVATKVGMRMGEGQNDSGLSKQHIIREFHNSLKRLGTDYVDILYLHAPDYRTPFEETLEAVDCLAKAGKLLYLGVSNFASWQVAALRRIAEGACRARPVLSQVVYNLLARGCEQEHIPFLKSEKMGLVTYNPLAGGLLTNKYGEKRIQENTRFSLNPGYRKRYWNEENLAIWDEFKKIAGEAGLSMSELSMLWLAGTGCVDSIITGFSNMEQLQSNLAALNNRPLDAATINAIDALWDKIGGNRFAYNR